MTACYRADSNDLDLVCQPELPNQVYAYNTHTKSVRCVADGFDMPNGQSRRLTKQPDPAS